MAYCDISFVRCRKILNAEKVAAYYRLLARMYMQYVLAMCSKNFFCVGPAVGKLRNRREKRGLLLEKHNWYA